MEQPIRPIDCSNLRYHEFGSGNHNERLFRTVKTRKKWFEFLLGVAPNFSEYSFTDEDPLQNPLDGGTPR